ncbi:hypothetical protein C8Q80DRAFT_914358 [Daedaleopsis nitida]|nr:hypothetical protein C8Q80DRAFT_914358 [Daedaleopsis nitida]
MRFSTVLALVASVAVASATPAPISETDLVARSGDGTASLTRRSGCGSTGPLGDGHYKWYITHYCSPGTHLYCQVLDASGCNLAGTRQIGSMEVDSDGVTIIQESNVNQLPFICPQSGQVQCQANFNDRNDGPNYSLRVHDYTPE